MSFSFEWWRPLYELGPVAFKDESAIDRVCMPKIEATDFKGNSFGCSGESVLFERNKEGAEFRMIVNSGFGGIHQPQPCGKILVLPQPPPFVFKLPLTRQWNINSKKLQGKNTLARVITMEFEDTAGGNQKDIRKLTITIPITMESDQANVFSYGLNWAGKVVAANIAYGEFYAATHANDYGGHGGL